MSPGLAKRLALSPTNNDLHSPGSVNSAHEHTPISTASTLTKSPTMTNSATSSSSASSNTLNSNHNAANIKIQNALEKNMQKLNSLPGKKSTGNINMANLSKEDIELFTQSINQQQLQQQYYQHAYNFTCDSLQTTPEHQIYTSNSVKHNDVSNQKEQILQQQYLMNQQMMPDSVSYYLNGTGPMHVMTAATPIQPYFIQNDLNNGRIHQQPIMNKANHLLRNANSAEREMTPDSIDENVNELTNITKKVSSLKSIIFQDFSD